MIDAPKALRTWDELRLDRREVLIREVKGSASVPLYEVEHADGHSSVVAGGFGAVVGVPQSLTDLADRYGTVQVSPREARRTRRRALRQKLRRMQRHLPPPGTARPGRRRRPTSDS